MSEQDQINVNKTELKIEWKAPLDVKIIAWFSIIMGIIALLLGILLLTGVAYIPTEHHKSIMDRILDRIIYTSSYKIIAMYTMIAGIMSATIGCLLIKGKRIGWYLAFVGSISSLADPILLFFSIHKISASIGILMSSIIIIWLIYRRNLYFIREKTE